MTPTARAIEAIRQDERKKIAAWMRAMHEDAGGIVRWLADRIERGDHAPEKEGEEKR